MGFDFKDKKGLSLLLLRLSVVFVFLWHGIPKAFNPAMAMEKFVSMGFPGFLGPIVGWAEVIGGVLLLIGLYHKYANYVLALIIAVALIFVQAPKGVTAGLERDLLILVAFFVLIAFGPGQCSMKK